MRFNVKVKRGGIRTSDLRKRLRGGDVGKQINSRSIHFDKTSGQIRLFTKHFDARAKILPTKQKPSVLHGRLQKQQNQDRNDVTTSSTFQRLFTDKLHRRTNATRPTTQRKQHEQLRPQREEITMKKANVDRHSIFTGTSITVVAKNEISNTRKPKKNRQSNRFTPRESERLKPASRRQSDAQALPTSPKSTLPAKVIVSNLHPNVTEVDIKELFGALGDLQRAVLKDLGTAEVIYSHSDDAFAAYSKYHGRNLDGQPMILKITTVEMTSDQAPQRRSRLREDMQPYTPSRSQQVSSTHTKPVVFTVKL